MTCTLCNGTGSVVVEHHIGGSVVMAVCKCQPDNVVVAMDSRRMTLAQQEHRACCHRAELAERQNSILLRSMEALRREIDPKALIEAEAVLADLAYDHPRENWDDCCKEPWSCDACISEEVCKVTRAVVEAYLAESGR